MVVKQKLVKTVGVNPEKAYRNLLSDIKDCSWEIIYKEKEDLEVFGMITGLGSSTITSMLT